MSRATGHNPLPYAAIFSANHMGVYCVKSQTRCLVSVTRLLGRTWFESGQPLRSLYLSSLLNVSQACCSFMSRAVVPSRRSTPNCPSPPADQRPCQTDILRASIRELPLCSAPQRESSEQKNGLERDWPPARPSWDLVPPVAQQSFGRYMLVNYASMS